MPPELDFAFSLLIGFTVMNFVSVNKPSMLRMQKEALLPFQTSSSFLYFPIHEQRVGHHKRLVCTRWICSVAKRVWIDLRTPEIFSNLHVVSSANIPLKELRARLYELPDPYGEPLGIVGGNKELTEASGVLKDKG